MPSSSSAPCPSTPRYRGADFVVADGHEWMMGPEGLGVFYTTPAAREALVLTQYGWHMSSQPGDFDRRDWEIADSGRRFEAVARTCWGSTPWTRASRCWKSWAWTPSPSRCSPTPRPCWSVSPQSRGSLP
ncbi:MAG: aminotransferase class V-fold PLP-dependent enzyme [Arhodomonas sp.]|nr:aminotransferase class V-fold PLP-dependent enzyme [Arhodomonas sp.]